MNDVILLVEDNPDDEVLTLRAIRKNHFPNPVVVVHNGLEALDYLFARNQYSGRDPEENPCLILLDLKLPKIDGLEVLRRLRANPSTSIVPVVVLTTSNEERDSMESYQSGANGYVRKPVDFQQFTKAIGSLGTYWLSHNIAPPRLINQMEGQAISVSSLDGQREQAR